MTSSPDAFYQNPYKSELDFMNKLGRALWGLVWTLLYRPSPRPCFAWRRGLVRLFGGQIAKDVILYSTARIYAPWNLEMDSRSCLGDHVDCYCVDKIRVGIDATVSQYAFLCTAGHDIDSPERILTTAPITLEPGAWVFARAFVGPGVTIHRGGVVAACAVVMKDVSEMTVVAGNPAREIRKRRAF